MRIFPSRCPLRPSAAALVAVALAGLSGPLSAQGSRGGEAQPPLVPADFTSLPEDGTFGLFLLVGQSNMKGRGAIDLNSATDARILFLHPTERKWFVARDPLHAVGTPDAIDGSDNSGTGPGMSFSKSLLGHSPDAAIGLVPAAKGGVPIKTYAPAGDLYTLSLEMLEDAAECSPRPTVVRAILWLQGESDAMTEAQVAVYEERLLDLVDRYRRDLKNPDLPVIVCTIGSFIAESDKAKRFRFTGEINEILLRLPQKRRLTACVDARDLKGHIGDSLHYNSTSQQEIGRRFAKAYRDLLRQMAAPSSAPGESDVVPGN